MTEAWLPFWVTEWLTACGFVLLLLEYVAMLTLWSPLAVVGIPALNVQLEAPLEIRTLHPGARPIISAVPCRVLSRESLVVRTIPNLISFSWHSPFPLKTVISVSPGRALVTGAVPVGSVLIFTGFGASSGIAALFVAGFALVCIVPERHRAVRVARTVLQRLSPHDAAG